MRGFIFPANVLFTIVIGMGIFFGIQGAIRSWINDSQIVYAGYCTPLGLEKAASPHDANVQLNLHYIDNSSLEVRKAWTTEPIAILYFVRSSPDSIFAEVQADGEARCKIPK